MPLLVPRPAVTDVIEVTRMAADRHEVSVEDDPVLGPPTDGVASVAHLAVDVSMAGTLLLADVMTIEIAMGDVVTNTANAVPLDAVVADPHPQTSCHMSRDGSSLTPSSHLAASVF